MYPSIVILAKAPTYICALLWSKSSDQNLDNSFIRFKYFRTTSLVWKSEEKEKRKTELNVWRQRHDTLLVPHRGNLTLSTIACDPCESTMYGIRLSMFRCINMRDRRSARGIPVQPGFLTPTLVHEQTIQTRNHIRSILGNDYIHFSRPLSYPFHLVRCISNAFESNNENTLSDSSAASIPIVSITAGVYNSDWLCLVWRT
jgi:hypothetical protein